MSRLLKAVPVLLIVVLAAFGIFATSCGSSDRTQIRFVHAIQDGAAMDIDVDGTEVFTDISFLGVLPNQPSYTSVPSGADTIEGFLTGTTKVGFNSTKVDWTGGQQYTIVATGLVADGLNALILSVPDNKTTPAVGNVVFRVIHASPSAPSPVDVYIELNPASGPTGTPAIAGLAYTQGSNYVSLAYNPNSLSTPPGFTVFVTAAGKTTPILTEEINPPDQGTRTLVLTDTQDGTTINSTFLELPD